MFKCTDCRKVVRTVAEVRNCPRCQSKGTAANIPTHVNDSDWLTPALIGYALGGGFSGHSHAPVEEATPTFTGGGGDTVGAGAGSSWSDDSDRSSGSSSSDSSYSSSDSGSSDSGGSSGGGSD